MRPRVTSGSRRVERRVLAAGVCLGLLAQALTLGAEAAAPDPGLRAFVAKFADMAARGAADAMGKVTRFPLRNRVYQQPGRIAAAEFKNNFTTNSFRELAACLKRTPPQRAAGSSADLGDWEVDCDGNIFYFAKDGAGWRFSGFENVNE